MRRGWDLSALRALSVSTLLLSLTFVTLGLTACAPAEKKADPKVAAAAADLAFLQETQPVLDAKRQELRQIQDRLAGNVPEAEEPPGDAAAEPPPSREELEAQAQSLEAEITPLSDQMIEKAVSYLNTTGIVVGGELTPEQRYAIDIKIGEDLLLAQEYVDKGGDYNRALDIYRQALQLDADNELVKAAIAQANELRYMSQERFAQVKKKMSQDEVRKLLGQVKQTNVHDFPERGVLGWFYKKEEGGAAGVYFKELHKGKGDWVVYNLDYDAVKQQVVGGDDDD